MVANWLQKSVASLLPESFEYVYVSGLLQSCDSPFSIKTGSVCLIYKIGRDGEVDEKLTSKEFLQVQTEDAYISYVNTKVNPMCIMPGKIGLDKV